MSLTFAYGVPVAEIECHDDESFYCDINRASATVSVADLLELADILEGRHAPEDHIILNLYAATKEETHEQS